MLDALGLLALTGLLWGCTNPFIRKGTQGLSNVHATTRFGQLHAELSFLLTNWKYVIPFMLNQAGSVTYIVAMQRAPLTLAVPAANSLAFAATALTGAAIGDEEPLDTKSIIGVIAIVAGTALCCWDKVE
ncbi:transmembrane protein 234 homolog isoform X1 [Hyposmocoma kahamanoa]|uniref:transmembrane protein 234 homolog isoform X1 n=1 Tax=Hyposmocoma kahamanoa TaxID=1477025 RepID=UPI000E6D61DC|nr:transmembrane protein 234 homolog isoform X1 [Hyposmocoma kahamanoa]